MPCTVPETHPKFKTGTPINRQAEQGHLVIPTTDFSIIFLSNVATNDVMFNMRSTCNYMYIVTIMCTLMVGSFHHSSRYASCNQSVNTATNDSYLCVVLYNGSNLDLCTCLYRSRTADI